MDAEANLENDMNATVTDTAIRDLRDEAAAAGDLAQSGLCTIALRGTEYDVRGLSSAEIDALLEEDWDALDTLPAIARNECARVIAQAVRS